MFLFPEKALQTGVKDTGLIFTNLSFYGTEYLLGIEAHTLFKHPDDLPDILDMLRNITINDYKISHLTHFDGADLIFQPKRLRAVVCCDAYRLNRAESRLRQEFDGLL